MKTAAIMCRVSSDEQALGFSLDVQQEALEKHCERENIHVIYKFREDHSAKDFNRPEFKIFMEYAKKNKGKIDYLLITSWDRFSRNITEALIVIRKLKELGINVYAIEQPIDLNIPENKAILAVYLAIPEIDNDRRSLKIKQGMRAALKAGRWCRSAPYGYKNSRDENNQPIIIPNEKADNIRFLFEQVAKGQSQQDIIEELKEKGQIMRKTMVSDVLRNPVYAGKIRVPANQDDPEEIVEGQHEGIVTESLFNKVYDLINDNHRKRNRLAHNTAKEELFLRGNLFCSNCGQKLTGSRSKSRNGQRYFYYHCNYCKSERHRADKLNEIILDILGSFQFKKEVRELYKEILKKMMSGNEEQRKRKIVKLKSELFKQNERIEKVQDMLVDGSISKSEFQGMITRYTKEKEQTERKIIELNSVKSAWEKHLEKGIGMLSNLEKTFNLADPMTKKHILGSIFPENLFFDGKKCRTARLNEVLLQILLIDRRIFKMKSGQLHKDLRLSAKVEHIGIEPMTS